MKVLAYSHDLKMVDFHPKDSDKVIHEFIQKCEQGGDIVTWNISIDGFNNDPRELIEIPEARDFAARLVDLGILITLLQPKPTEGSYQIQSDCPGLNGLSLYAISCESGKVKRHGKRVSIRMNIDLVGYFSALLKTLKERNAPADVIASLEEGIAKRKEFDPISGSSKFISDTVFDEVVSRLPSRGFSGLGYPV